MKMRNRFLAAFVIACALLFFSCEKETVKPVEQTPQDIRKWERFVGKYNVFSPDGSQFKYAMEIQGIKHVWLSLDSISFKNLSNKFNFQIPWGNYYPYAATEDDELMLIYRVHHPIIGSDGLSWHLSGLYQDTLRPGLENILIGDTIFMYYTLSNASFYIQDGVPYFHEEVLEMAIKQK